KIPDDGPSIYNGDITVVCYYVTAGRFFNGYYDSEYVNNGYGTTIGDTNRKVFRVDIFHHTRDIDQLYMRFRKEDGYDGVRVSDLLVTVLKGSQRQEDLNKWLGVPHRNAINPVD